MLEDALTDSGKPSMIDYKLRATLCNTLFLRDIGPRGG
jgi:hypothetical protein